MSAHCSILRKNLTELSSNAHGFCVIWDHTNADMASASNGRIQQVSSMSELDENLLSMENLDRTSPELWPEKIPGMSNFVNQTAAPNTSGQPWNKELDSEDINLLHQFGSLTAASLIAEVKKLHDIAYELGLQEAKEMTRGKYLNILSRNQH